MVTVEASDDPYCNEPIRSQELQAVSLKQKPYNAQSPPSLPSSSSSSIPYITPNDLWYVRHHHPVPVVDPSEFTLEMSLTTSSYPAPTLEAQREAAMEEDGGGERRKKEEEEGGRGGV